MIRVFLIMTFLMVLAAKNMMVCKALETLPASKASLETLTGPGRWYAVEFEGGGSSSSSSSDTPMCGNGTPFSFLFRKATSSQHDTKWLVEFQSSGGPACWLSDAEGGDGGSCCQASPSQLQTPWYDNPVDNQANDASPLPFLMVDDVPACVGWPEGLVQHDAAQLFHSKSVNGPTNSQMDVPIPLRSTSQDTHGDWWQGDIQEYNYVLIPDCTADAHLGMMTKSVEYDTSCNTQTTNTTAPPFLSIHHRGGINRRAVMDWIQKDDQHVVDAVITVAGGRSLKDGNARSSCHSSHDPAPYFSSMAPLLASAQVATEFHSTTTRPQTLTIQEGAGLFLDGMPTRFQLESSWNVQDDDLWDDTMIGGSSESTSGNTNTNNNDLLDMTHVAQQLVTDLVSSSSNSDSNDPIHRHTVVWTASAQDPMSQLEWLDPLQSQGLPIHVYLTQDMSSPSLHTGDNEEQRSCPRFAFPDHSEGFAQFLATKVAWNPQTTTIEKTTDATAIVSAERTKYRLTFLSVALIVVGLVFVLYATYFGLCHYRLQHGQPSPPSPADLWFRAMTRYPGIFLTVSLGIPILLSVLAFHRQGYQVKVNLDFDSYLEINTDLENTRRAYEWKQDQQWASRDAERDHCDHLNKESGENDSMFANRFRRRQLQLQDKGVNLTVEQFDLAHAVDWDRLLVDRDHDIDAGLGFYNTNSPLDHRRLNLANMLYASGGEVISIMYQNANGGNVFEPDVLKDIHAFEQAIYTFPGFSNYCFGFAGVRCLPIDSLVAYYFDSAGRLTENIDGVTRSFLGNQPALWKLDQYFGPDNLGSNVTRSFVFLRNVGGDQSRAHPFLESFYRHYLWETDSPNRPKKKPYKKMVHTWDNAYLNRVEAQDALNHDTMWSIGSLAFIALMIALKVRNLFVTCLSMLGLILSFFTAYYWVSAHFAIENATLLWVAGLFVMLGIGADDIFLMVDSFQHTKSTHSAVVGGNDDASNAEQNDARLDVLRQRMIEAYRTAGSMMLVSSVTTAICFFSNAFGVLVVIQEFGIFMGMVVLVNYIHVMTILPSAILVNEFYVIRFWTWLQTKTGRVGTLDASEEQEGAASRYDLETANMSTTGSSCSSSKLQSCQSHVKLIDEGGSSHQEASMSGMDRLFVDRYAPFLNHRRLLVLAGCLLLAFALGIVGVFKFTMGDGSIVLFSEQYNLGRLSVVNDLYFNSAISKTIEENQADPTFAPVGAPTRSSSSSSGSSASLPGSVTQGGGSSNTGDGFSGSSTGYNPGVPQDHVGNVPPQDPVGNVAGSNSHQDSASPPDDDRYAVTVPGSDVFGPSEGSNTGSGSSYPGSGFDSSSGPGSGSNSGSGSSSSTSAGVATGNVGAIPLGPNSNKDLRRVEAVNIRLIWGVKPPPTSASALWKMPERASRSTGIHEGLEPTSTLDLSRPEVQSWLLATIDKARQDNTMHVLDEKLWIENLRDYATNNSIDFPIPQEAFEGHLQRFKQQNEVFAKQIDDHIGTLGPGLAGDYTFVSLEFQADAVASLDGAPSTALSEIVYKKWTNFASKVNAEEDRSPKLALPTVVAQSRIFLDAYRVDATIESTVITWLVANGLCMLVILLFTHNLALSFMVMVTITLILLCLGGILFGLAKIPFGPIEALGVSIFIGLSANYSLHVVHAYQHSPIGMQTRSAKIEHAIFAVGSPIVASALSTMGAAAFFFGCRTWVFVELGILLLCITSMALLFSMTFLLAWLSLVGPGAYLDHRGKMVHQWDLRELCWTRCQKSSCRQGQKGGTMDQMDNVVGFELAAATAKCRPSAISTDKDGSLQNGSMVTSASSSALSTQSSGHENNSSSTCESVELDDDDDYSIEVTSDGEED